VKPENLNIFTKEISERQTSAAFTKERDDNNGTIERDMCQMQLNGTHGRGIKFLEKTPSTILSSFFAPYAQSRFFCCSRMGSEKKMNPYVCFRVPFVVYFDSPNFAFHDKFLHLCC
jgi:hypothetical protein